MQYLEKQKNNMKYLLLLILLLLSKCSSSVPVRYNLHESYVGRVSVIEERQITVLNKSVQRTFKMWEDVGSNISRNDSVFLACHDDRICGLLRIKNTYYYLD